MHYRKLWSLYNGPIPKDINNRTFELHHINGNHKDSRIENLKLVTIQQHYWIHLLQNDFVACALIGKRMGFTHNHFSDIQRGKKRPGIGGVKKGNIPWNVNVKGYSLNVDRRGQCYNYKLSAEVVTEIRKLFQNLNYIPKGRLSSERQFAKDYYQKYNVTEASIYNIVTGKTWSEHVRRK